MPYFHTTTLIKNSTYRLRILKDALTQEMDMLMVFSELFTIMEIFSKESIWMERETDLEDTLTKMEIPNKNFIDDKTDIYIFL